MGSKLLSSCCILLLTLASTHIEASERVEEVFAYASDLQSQHPQLCIAIGSINGSNQEVEHFGCDSGDFFQIGSITKVFTSIALASSTHVTKNTALGDIFAEGLSPPVQQITLEQLATHTSGLPRLPDNIDLASIEDPYKNYGVKELMAYLASYQPNPNTTPSFGYSNLGVGLLGHALGVSEGKSYDQVITDNVLTPLKLRNTLFHPSSVSKKEKVLQGHNLSGQPVTNWSFDVLAGAGALWSTLPDMMRFASAQLGKLKTPLDQALTTTQQSRASAGPGMEVGLGWMIDTNPPAITWHNGATAGFRSWLGFNKDRGQAAIILANGNLSEVDLMGPALMGREIRLPTLSTSEKLDATDAKDYLGRYKLNPQTFLDVTLDDNTLYIQLTGQPKFKLLSTGVDQFRTELVPAELVFTRKKARISRVTIHQGGKEIKGRRIGEVPTRTKLMLPAEQLEIFVGGYQIQRNFHLEITLENNSLWVQATGQPKFPIFAESHTRFYLEVVAADLEFKVEDDQVKGVWLHQNGKHYGKKTK